MKELYTSPEVRLISFEAEERIAAEGEVFAIGSEPYVATDDGDISINFSIIDGM